MPSALSVRDLLLPGEPLHPGEVLASSEWLGNPVSWAASLRPYPPAFPRLRGQELALVAAEHVQRLDPPTSMADVIRQLASREASAVAVRGPVDQEAVKAAEEHRLPLIALADDAALHDIEQAIMRICAMHQALASVRGASPEVWLRSLLEGGVEGSGPGGEVPKGIDVSALYAIALVRNIPSTLTELLSAPYEDGIALLVAAPDQRRVLESAARDGLPCGLGTSGPLHGTWASAREALLALRASEHLREGRPVRFEELGPDRLLLVMHRDSPGELARYVRVSLGSLIDADRGKASPLLPTVRAFVGSGGKLRETAEALSVHRNTLAYRLQRASQVLGADLHDPAVRLGVELSLRALPLVSDELASAPERDRA